MNLAQWRATYGGTDSLQAGIYFPLQKDQSVRALKPIRANRYVKRGEILRFSGLGYMQALFRNAKGQSVKLSHPELAFICEC